MLLNKRLGDQIVPQPLVYQKVGTGFGRPGTFNAIRFGRSFHGKLRRFDRNNLKAACAVFKKCLHNHRNWVLRITSLLCLASKAVLLKVHYGLIQ
jgi:hypothetical protein